MVTAIQSQPQALDLSGLLALTELELVRPRLDARGEPASAAAHQRRAAGAAHVVTLGQLPLLQGLTALPALTASGAASCATLMRSSAGWFAPSVEPGSVPHQTRCTR